MKQSGAVRCFLSGLTAVVGIGLCAIGCGGGGGPAGGVGGAGGAVPVQPVTISAAARTPRTTTWSVNYGQWAPAYGDQLPGTEPLIAALAPALMRVGGYNNDANTPDPFDDAQLDAAVAYARAIGAQPIMQVPLLADTTGQPATADAAAAMVRYANVTQGYGIKYFSVGNEPDLYATQGLPSDATQPAIPGFAPSDYCTAARAYVAAMKAVDPTITIVGPDLAYKYQAGNPDNDWLTPILQGCGDLFDVVSIHRYPFASKQATLSAAAADAASFRAVMASVRGIMQATGQGAKPLALTEMNVAYDATTCVLDAAPGTIGSALWMADALGTAMEIGLWSSVVWNISDTEAWSLGLVGPPPAHDPRPAYYAYALYAQHAGPTLLGAPAVPSGVSAHASRNAADDATEIVLANWNHAAVGLKLQVSGLAGAAPAPVTFVLPAVSIAAVEIADSGAAAAWAYAEAQRLAGAGLQPLAAVGGAPAADAGAGGATGRAAGKTVGAGCAAVDAGVTCPQIAAVSPSITTMGSASGAALTFGPGGQKWGSYAYAASGQTAPTAAVTADGNGIQIMGGFVAPVASDGNYAGFGLYFASSSCLDASAYHGFRFDFSGDLGGCRVALGAAFSGDLSHGDDATRGACPGTSATCYAPYADVTAAALAATVAAPTVEVPFSAITGGMPVSAFDPATIVGVQWQLSAPAAAGGGLAACAAAFTVANVRFY
jgi:hypothetical protein